MKKRFFKTILATAIIGGSLGFGLVGCGNSTASASSSDYTAYMFFNGQYIKYDNVQNYDTDEDGTVNLKMTDGKKIKLYSPGNITVVTKGAIPDQQPQQDKKGDKK